MAKNPPATPADKSERPEEIAVRILEREFRLAVKPSERPQLEKAVEMVDEKMRSLRDGGRITGIDRIAVMAALQIANELVTMKPGGRATGDKAVNAENLKKIRKLNDRLEAELDKQQEDLF